MRADFQPAIVSLNGIIHVLLSPALRVLMVFGLPHAANASPPLSDLEPERGTICFGCIKDQYRLRANLDWESTPGGRRDLDIHTIRYFPDPDKEIVYFANRRKFLRGGLSQAPMFGWLDCDDLGNRRDQECIDRLGEDFRVKNHEETSGVLRYCFAVVQYGSGEAKQPYSLVVAADGVVQEYAGELAPFGARSYDKLHADLEDMCENRETGSGTRMPGLEADFYAIDIGADGSNVVDHNLPEIAE